MFASVLVLEQEYGVRFVGVLKFPGREYLSCPLRLICEVGPLISRTISPNSRSLACCSQSSVLAHSNSGPSSGGSTGRGSHRRIRWISQRSCTQAVAGGMTRAMT